MRILIPLHKPAPQQRRHRKGFQDTATHQPGLHLFGLRDPRHVGVLRAPHTKRLERGVVI